MSLCRFVLAAACMAFAFFPVVAWAAGKRYAVLVGVEKYQHAKLTALQYAVDDVTDLGKLLTTLGYEVVLLTDETGQRDARLRPTKANVDSQLSTVLRKCDGTDTVVLGFAGHGLQFTGQKDAYFCPVDARPFADETESLVSVTKIYSELEKSFAGVKVIFIDACRNDPDPGRGRGLDADSGPAPPKGVAALFSCSAGQKAFEHDQLKHGVFFHHVLEGLKGEAADKKGDVTFYGLANYVNQQVPESVDKLLPGKEQSPNMKADLAGRPPVLARVSSVKPEPPPGNVPKAGVLSAGTKAGQEWEGNGLKMKFRWCPDGTFLMGSPAGEKDRNDDEDQVSVTLTGFWLGQHEVTQSEWQSVMGTTLEEQMKKRANTAFLNGEGPTHPMYYVTHADATEFARKYTQQERAAGRLPAGWEYRLPTEAQWEYGCRAGTKTRFASGDDLKDAWNKRDLFMGEKTYAVGHFSVNPWGLADVHGNVEEWCRDWYQATLPGGKDPEVVKEGSNRVTRGGSLWGDDKHCRSANRYKCDPGVGSPDCGFRITAVRVGQ